MMQVIDIMSRDQIAKLRDAGFVVIHREPTLNMKKAFYAKNWPECVLFDDGYHRMIGQSIREQNNDND